MSTRVCVSTYSKVKYKMRVAFHMSRPKGLTDFYPQDILPLDLQPRKNLFTGHLNIDFLTTVSYPPAHKYRGLRPIGKCRVTEITPLPLTPLVLFTTTLYVTQTFYHYTSSSQGLFATKTFCHYLLRHQSFQYKDHSTQRLFATRTFQHLDFSPPGHFTLKTFTQYRLYTTRTFRHQDY